MRLERRLGGGSTSAGPASELESSPRGLSVLRVICVTIEQPYNRGCVIARCQWRRGCKKLSVIARWLRKSESLLSCTSPARPYMPGPGVTALISSCQWPAQADTQAGTVARLSVVIGPPDGRCPSPLRTSSASGSGSGRRLPAGSQRGPMLKLEAISKWWSGMVVPVLMLVLGRAPGLAAPQAARATQCQGQTGPSPP